LFYGLGFVLIVIGRYQLFTENTLTPVMLVLHRQCGLWLMLQMWAIVLAGNLVGAAATSAMLYYSGVFDEAASAKLTEIALEALHEPTRRLFWASVMAGGLVATMMWLIMAVRESSARILIVLLIAFVIPTATLHHCVFGTTEALYPLFAGEASLLQFFRFLGLAIVGNTLGGVVLVSLINYAQTHNMAGDEV
jgi:formate/nitrite transporter FocA (FNT family)